MIYKKIKSMQKSADQNDYLDAYINRKLSAPLSVFFVKIGASANFITLLSLFADLYAIYLMYANSWIFAGILVYLAAILDCSDGEVARYWKSKEENPRETKYGGYLDETLGTIGFTLVIFATGYFLNNPVWGFVAMYGLFMVLITSLSAQVEFPKKKEVARELQDKVFGKFKGRIGFSNVVQRMIITFAVIFQSINILVIFAIATNLFWMLKFYVYRNQ
jgi:phosphatidylglycerophosphate synthase